MRVTALALAFTLLAPTAAVAAPAWVLTPDGLGPLRIGMTVKQARAALGREMASDDEFSESCKPYGVTGLEGLGLIFADGRLDSIDINLKAPWRTAAGIGLGDTEAAVRKAYGRAIVRTKNAYEDPPAAYLTIKGRHGRGIKFTTDSHRRIEAIDVGGESISYIEGCA